MAHIDSEGPPGQGMVRLQTAPTGRRLLATAIDLAILLFLLLPLLKILGNGQSEALWPYFANSLPAWGLVLGVNLYNLHSNGQSIGKLLTRIRVGLPDGGRAPFSRLIFRRYLPLLILAALPYLGPLLLAVAILSAPLRQGIGLHDSLSGTRVIPLIARDPGTP